MVTYGIANTIKTALCCTFWVLLIGNQIKLKDDEFLKDILSIFD